MKGLWERLVEFAQANDLPYSIEVVDGSPYPGLRAAVGAVVGYGSTTNEAINACADRLSVVHDWEDDRRRSTMNEKTHAAFEAAMCGDDSIDYASWLRLEVQQRAWAIIEERQPEWLGKLSGVRHVDDFRPVEVSGVGKAGIDSYGMRVVLDCGRLDSDIDRCAREVAEHTEATLATQIEAKRERLPVGLFLNGLTTPSVYLADPLLRRTLTPEDSGIGIVLKARIDFAVVGA